MKKPFANQPIKKSVKDSVKKHESQNEKQNRMQKSEVKNFANLWQSLFVQLRFPLLCGIAAASLLLPLITIMHTAEISKPNAMNAIAAEDDGGYASPVAIVELYTSQGCYSCPPAEEVLRQQIASRPNIMALEFHVDYWDDLVHGGATWRDPFSNNEYTQRQTRYNQKLRDTRSVFTPQAITHGHSQAGGTHKDAILQAVQQSLQSTPKARFRFSGGKGEPLQVQVDGTLAPNVVLTYAMYWKTRTTEVLHGENKGKNLINTNVVYTLEQLPFGKRQTTLPDYDQKTQSCAVWLQRGNAGQIVSAAKCPFDV